VGLPFNASNTSSETTHHQDHERDTATSGPAICRPTTTHQRNFPFVQPLTIRVTTSPVQSPPFPQPSLKPTSFLPIFRRRDAPGTRSRQPKKLSLCVDSRALAEACRCELRPFPFLALQIQWSLTKSRSLDFGTTTIVETGTTGLD
jgi:hypothetical protein